MILIGYTYIGLMLAAMAVVSAWMFVSSKHPVTLRVIAASIVAVLAVTVWLNVTAVLGFAINGVPPDGAVVYSIVDAKREGSIYLWIADKSGPRGYRLPYSEGLARDLLRGEHDAQDNGGLMILHIHKKGTGKPGGGGNSDQEIKDGKNPGVPIAGGDWSVEIDVVPLLPPKM
jgi:hypothetical protein